MSSTNRGSERAPRDLYQTPEWVIDIWAKRAAKISQTKHEIVDIGCGDGRIGCAIADSTLSGFAPVMIDIKPLGALSGVVKPVDFLKDPLPCCAHSYVFFVSNPPFFCAFEFVQRAVGMLGSDEIASFLLRLNFLGSLKRSAWLKQHPPSALTVLAPRPSFTGCGTDSCEYAIFWWGTGSLLPPIEVAAKGES